MRRRELMLLLGASITAPSTVVQGQAVRRIGVLANNDIPERRQAFLGGLREHGYVVSQNLQIEWRFTQARFELIPELVAELVAFLPDIIITSGPQNAVAVHATAPTIPLIFIAVADPVALALVKSLPHPGTNATGFATLVNEEFVGKQLQLLKEVVPQTSRIAVLVNPTNPIHLREQAKLSETGRLLGVELIIVEASKPDQLDAAFETAYTQRVRAVHV